jgi:hypothetical protein
MRSFAEQKVRGGKLVSVELEYSDRIESVKILGDFFLYPEEVLYKIEKSLIGIDVSSTKEKISDKIGKVVSEEGAELIGMTPEAIAETIIMAVKK